MNPKDISIPAAPTGPLTLEKCRSFTASLIDANEDFIWRKRAVFSRPVDDVHEARYSHMREFANIAIRALVKSQAAGQCKDGGVEQLFYEALLPSPQLLQKDFGVFFDAATLGDAAYRILSSDLRKVASDRTATVLRARECREHSVSLTFDDCERELERIVCEAAEQHLGDDSFAESADPKQYAQQVLDHLDVDERKIASILRSCPSLWHSKPESTHATFRHAIYQVVADRLASKAEKAISAYAEETVESQEAAAPA